MAEFPEKDLYAVLGANASDSVQQLRHKYQQLALQFHPDRLVGEETTQLHWAVNRFIEVEAAWRILSDLSSRREYDLQRRGQTSISHPSIPPWLDQAEGREQELKQDGPVDSVVYLEDMTWDQGAGVYTHDCRCGGGFSLSKEVLEEETQLMEEDGLQGAVLVCCDTCSLSVCVTHTR
ncbi:dnaJ homolog subfamily C member 24 isoform X1 [Gouania willdenowi]|uniref:dnaJ homolog subfamily C member 24 isoform X1 n=1 Tax=Gouania willdenowi TaxID=441366 RepID=UPI0010545353|nr:dnaJ homolog subfamily C member 24 isoform X1 [Gouania willdenowi]